MLSDTLFIYVRLFHPHHSFTQKYRLDFFKLSGLPRYGPLETFDQPHGG